MKVLIVTENAYSGGLDTFLITLINSWPNAEDRLTLVCNTNHPGLSFVRRSVVRQCEVIGHDYPLPWPTTTMSRARRLLLFPFRLLERQLLFVRYLRIFRELFDRTGAERLLVVNGGYPAGLTCRAATVAWGMAGRRPQSIHNFHNFSHPPRVWERPFEYVIDRLVHRHAGAMVSVSRICALSLENRSAFRGSTKVTHIPNGISYRPAKATRAEVRAELGVPPDAPLLLMLGTYEVRKGHEFLLQAFGQVLETSPFAWLAICGFGYPAEIERVRAAVASLSLDDRVLLLGFREDVPDLLEASDILLVPSQASESFGLTIVEAMSHSVPVIATRIGGIPEVIEDGDGGYLVARDDVVGLARRIVLLLGDEALRREQGRRGLARFEERFGAERMARAYAEMLHRGQIEPGV